MRMISESTVDHYLRFSRNVRFEPDISHLAQGDVSALKELIEAADIVNRIFLKQDHPQSTKILDELITESKTSKKAQKVLKVFQIFNGPIGVSYKANRNVKLVECDKRSAGGAVYPTDLKTGELCKYKKAHPEQVADLESHYTVVRRRNQNLITIPYHQEYKVELEEVAERLKKASTLATNLKFRRYLRSRARALLSDDYYQSDVDWMDCEESPIDISIGPIEYYGDHLDGKKAFYEAQITVRNQVASQKLAKYQHYLQQLEDNILFHSHRDLSATILPLQASDVLFRSGWCKCSGGGIVSAQILPNDEKVAREKGRRISFFKNIMGQRVKGKEEIEAFLSPEFRHLYSPEVFYEFVTGHEISHALGPKITKNGKEIKDALGDKQMMLEEMKADVLSLYNLQFLMQQGVYTREEIERIYVTEGILGLIPLWIPKFTEAHRMTEFLILNYFLEHKSIELKGGLLTINFPKAFEIVENLARELLELQFAGDVGRVDEFIKKYYRPNDETIKYLCQKRQSLKLKKYYIIEQPLAERLAGRTLY